MKISQNLYKPSRQCTSAFTHSILFSGVILALFISGCEKPKEQIAASPTTVQVIEVIQKDVPVQQEWVGTLDGMVNAQINAQVAGYLVKQNYKEGDQVKKGQLMYEIDPRTFKASLDEAKGNLARQQAVLKTAQLNLARIKRRFPLCPFRNRRINRLGVPNVLNGIVAVAGKVSRFAQHQKLISKNFCCVYTVTGAHNFQLRNAGASGGLGRSFRIGEIHIYKRMVGAGRSGNHHLEVSSVGRIVIAFILNCTPVPENRHISLTAEACFICAAVINTIFLGVVYFI